MAYLCGGLQCRVGGKGSYWTLGSMRGCVSGCGDAAVTLVVSFSYDCSFCMGWRFGWVRAGWWRDSYLSQYGLCDHLGVPEIYASNIGLNTTLQISASTLRYKILALSLITSRQNLCGKGKPKSKLLETTRCSLLVQQETRGLMVQSWRASFILNALWIVSDGCHVMKNVSWQRPKINRMSCLCKIRIWSSRISRFGPLRTLEKLNLSISAEIDEKITPEP